MPAKGALWTFGSLRVPGARKTSCAGGPPKPRREPVAFGADLSGPGYVCDRELGIQDASASVGRDEHDGQALVSGALDRVTGRRGVGINEGSFLGIGGVTFDREVDRFVHDPCCGRSFCVGVHCLSHPSIISRYRSTSKSLG